MDCFYVDPKDVHGRTLIIRGEEQKHLVRVLRKQVGDKIAVVDGCDNSFEAVIRSVSRVGAECEIIRSEHRANEPEVDITLAVSILRNPARFDFLVEKATELGARGIVPTICERTVARRERQARLEKIALAAMKQCGRSYLPRIARLVPFRTAIEQAGGSGLRLIPHKSTEESQFIATVLQLHLPVTSVFIIIGPEGGFTADELALALGKGFIAVSLGPRRLRSETAALSALSWVVGGG